MTKILIADDEPNMRVLLKQTLEELEGEGVELLVADNGVDALNYIKIERPELAVLDAKMPGINGYEVCDTVKNKLDMKDIYLLMLTAKSREFDKQKGKDVGIDFYMTKPFDPDELLKKAIEVLGIA